MLTGYPLLCTLGRSVLGIDSEVARFLMTAEYATYRCLRCVVNVMLLLSQLSVSKTFGHILFRPFCFVVHACRIAGFCFLFVSSIYENWSISTSKHTHSMVLYSRPGMSNLLIY